MMEVTADWLNVDYSPIKIGWRRGARAEIEMLFSTDDQLSAWTDLLRDKVSREALVGDQAARRVELRPTVRPYLPFKVREKLFKSVTKTELAHFFRPGEVMHVDMDEVEASWIVKCAGQKERQRRPIQWSEIAEELEGRDAKGAEHYYRDYKTGKATSDHQVLIAGEQALVMQRPKKQVKSTTRKSITQTSPFGVMNRLVADDIWPVPRFYGGYHPVTSWAGCSGAVIQMATTASPLPGGLYTCLIGSATETDQSRQQRNNIDDPYNRQGELCSFQASPTRIKCRVLDGHRTARMRSTVSCVIHSDNNSAFVAGGYDGCVTVWSDDKLGLLARFGGGTATINAVVADAKTYGVLYGTSAGELVWCPDPLSVDESGRTRLRSICAPAQVPQGQALPLANAVDVLVMTSKAASPVACAGFGYLSSPYRGGIVQCYDMATQSLSCCIKVDTQPRCLTDVALHPDERLLAIGTGILVDGKALRGDGRIRLRDFRRPTDNAADDLATQQMDIHRLAFSPSSPNLLFSNDASTGLMLVHDLRYSKRALWSHTHSNASSDAHEHYQGFAWCPSTGALLTGGNDGLLKVWDLASANPLKEAHDIGQPVNNITVSADATNLWVGTEYGAVHMLSRNPSLQDAFRDNIAVAYDPIQQQ